MEPLRIAATDETPEVTLDAGNNIFELEGRSLPEDVVTFYGPVFEWLDKYSESPNDMTNFQMKLDYFNTASSKMILDILLKLEDMQDSGKQVMVTWHYAEDDEDMQEAGEEYEEIVDVPFEHKAYE